MLATAAWSEAETQEGFAGDHPDPDEKRDNLAFAARLRSDAEAIRRAVQKVGTVLVMTDQGTKRTIPSSVFTEMCQLVGFAEGVLFDLEGVEVQEIREAEWNEQVSRLRRNLLGAPGAE